MSDPLSDQSGRTDSRGPLRRYLRRFGVPVLRSAALIASIVVALGVAARYTPMIDKYFVFFPQRELVQDPGDRGMDFEDVSFTAKDGVELHGWFVPGQRDVTLVWFHGNAGNISHRVDNLAALHGRLGVNVFIFDYRGFGRSGGAPSERGLYMDAEAALAYLSSRPDVDPARVVLFGRSIGCAVAVEAATKNGAHAVVLESPFTSTRAMAKRVYWFLPGIGLLAPNKYDSLSRIRDVHAPVMVLHGDRDEIVPFDMGRELFDAANPPKRFYTIVGAGHNDTYVIGGPAYYDALASFLEDPTGGERGQ